jgi:divalent metal cation (Fe/Co/Zn/Cd) transporter
LEADGKHLMTDVWTTAGIIIGIGAIAGLQFFGHEGWEVLDPIIAILVAINILWVGIGLMRRTFAGLMDVVSISILVNSLLIFVSILSGKS